MTIAEQIGYFKAEGLDVTIVDFAGGAKALHAVVGVAEIIKAVPESYLLGDRAVYIVAFLAAKGSPPPDGMIPEKGPQTAFKALASVDEKLAAAKLDLSAVYTNNFVKMANAKYPKG